MDISHYDLGVAAVQAGDLKAAVQEFQRAIAQDPADPEAHYRLGWALASQGYLDPALPHFRRALELDPGHGNAHYNLGAVLLQKAQLEADQDGLMELVVLEEAKQEFEAVMRLDPEDQRAFAFLTLIRKAIQRYREAIPPPT